MRVSLVICGIGLLALTNFGYSSTTPRPKKYFDEDGQGDFAVRQKREDPAFPNATTIEALKTVSNLPVIGFFTALRNLYLDGGFSVDLKFNAAILGQPVMSDQIYQEVIRSLEQTRWEVKNGEGALKRIQAMLKLNNPETVIYQPSLINLISEIMEKSVNPKNVAFSIRDFGASAVKNRLTRTSYSNGTFLRKFIDTWQDEQLKTESSSGFRWTSSLLLIHHIIGTENFGALGDILESQPWLTNGMYNGDSEFLRYYQFYLKEMIYDVDMAEKIQKVIFGGFENFTLVETLLDQLAENEIILKSDLAIFADVQGQPVAVDDSVPDRNENSMEKYSTIWAQVGDAQAKEKFGLAAKKAMDNGIGGLEGVRNAFLAGARLVKNLGSVENAVKKCEELQGMTTVVSMPSTRFDAAFEITKLLNFTDSDGNYGFQMLFDLYFGEAKAPNNQFLFQYSRTMNVDDMQTFFKAMNLDPSTGFPQLITTLATKKYRRAEFETILNSLANDATLISDFQRVFNFQSNSLEQVQSLRSALRSLLTVSPGDVELLDNIRSVRSIQLTNSSTVFFNSLVTVATLGRDKTWFDVQNALGKMYEMTTGPSTTSSVRSAVFKGLKEMIGTTGSYQEVFLSLKSLLEIPSSIDSKCTFISDFFTGQDVDTVTQAFKVSPSSIRHWNEASISVDSLIQLLRNSIDRATLGKLLAFHTFNTVNPNPNITVENITNLLVYLYKQGAI